MFCISKIKFYAEKMLAEGVSPEEVLVGSGLGMQQLEDRHYQVTPEQYQLVVSNMLALSGKDDLGIDIGLCLRPTDYGVLGYAMSTCETLAALYAIWERYNHALYGAALKTQVAQTSNRTFIETQIMLPPGAAYRFCMEELLFSARTFMQILIDPGHTLSLVELNYAEPIYARRMSSILKCPVKYQAGRNVMHVEGRLLEASIKSNNLELHQLYSSLCQKLAGELPGQPLSQRIRAIFLQRPGRIPGMPEMANMLHTSVRTLRRDLAAEGRSYRDLVNEFRCNYVKEYLRTTRLSIKEIAFALGYQDDKALIKAFKNQLGVTPGQFREEGRIRNA